MKWLSVMIFSLSLSVGGMALSSAPAQADCGKCGHAKKEKKMCKKCQKAGKKSCACHKHDHKKHDHKK